MKKVRVLQVGLGPLGVRMIRQLLDRQERFELIGAVDIDPQKEGRDVGEVCGLGRSLGVAVRSAPAASAPTPDVALVTTVSSLERLASQLPPVFAIGCDIVSTCEELSYPWQTQPTIAKQLDDQARAAGVTLVGTGVNPGFLMDYLPSVLTSVCHRVEAIRVDRTQDATIRRLPFQQKIGAGLDLAAFEARRQQGTLRHVGLTESLHMLAAAAGWRLDRTEDELSPIVAERPVASEQIHVQPGQAAGVQQVGRGFVNGEERITLTFRAALGEPDPRDAVEIVGEPAVRSVIHGGVNGDIATCALTLNAAATVAHAQPGLKTMLDLPVVGFRR